MKIKVTRFSPALFITLIITSCNQYSPKQDPPQIIDTVDFVSKDTVPPGDTIMKAGKDAGKVYNLILSLPEVSTMARYIQEHTKGVRHLEVMIAESPKDTIQNYYWVKAGEDNGMNYVTHYNFYVYPDANFEIKYFDTVNDV
jgi:hypothetical protein